MAETEMVERVARAICASAGTIWGGPKGDDDPDFLLPKLMYLSMARAAIEEMREPTRAMVDAGVLDTKADVSFFDVNETYRAMIDAALSPPSKD